MNERVLLKDHTSGRLAEELSISPRLARRLQAAVVRGGRRELPRELPEVSPRVLAEIRERAEVPHLEVLHKTVSPRDGFTKYVFRGAGNEPFETVRIPLLHRSGREKYVVCVSSQVGCPLACTFCATGRMGLLRNLQTWEMVDQVVQVAADSEYAVRGVVFMGMGEPLLNYDRVLRAAEILAEPCGMAIAAKAISISTAGVVPGIRRLTAEQRPYRLVVSLTTADPARRRELMPIEHAYPLDELMAAVREHQAATGTRIMLAYTMISGVNTRPEDARLLARLTAGLPIKVDLIDVNDATGRYRPPGDEERARFRDALREHLGMPVARRYSGGQDIGGGCGMLAGFSAEPASLARHATPML